MMKNIFSRAVNITNRNVYLTNILLLPALIYTILGIYDIHNWRDIPRDKNFSTYLSLWYVLALLISLVIIFSTIFHVFMYSNTKPTLQLLGKVDHKLTAPLFSLVILILNYIYFLFLNKPCPNTSPTVDSLVLYIVTCLFTGFGMISWILKHYIFHPRYNRGTLLMTIYYIDNKEIYKSLLLNKC